MSVKIRGLDDFLLLLKGVKPGKDGQVTALCPGHDDHNRSLSVKQADGKLLVKCFAGCDTANILNALQLEAGDLFFDGRKAKTRKIETIYNYIDAEGKPFEVVRTRPKGFYQRRPDGKGGHINNLEGITTTLYHADELTEAIAAGTAIFIVEGEKDVDRLRTEGFTATCNPMGAGKWRNSYNEALHGADLCIIPDNDGPGRDHANQVAKSVYGIAGRVRLLELPGDCKDISDWLDSGGDVEQLKQLVATCPDYVPPPEPLSITIDNTTYFERLDLNRIISHYQPSKEDALPVITTLTSFTIKPKIRITLDGGNEMLDTVLKTGSTEYPTLFKREAWNSKRQFLAALPSVYLQYYGNDKETQAILAMVTSKKLPIREGTTVLGRNGDFWVLRGGVFSKDGWLEDPKQVYIPSEVEFDRRVHYPTPQDETTLIKQIIPLLLMLNEGKIILPVLGWFFATPFAPEIRRRLHHFPLLVVWGTPGGGKSSLLSLLWELFGVKSELFSSTETPFTFLRVFSSTSSIPIIIDEFKPFNMKEDEARLLIRYLKRLYDGEIEYRGRPDLSLVAYHLQAPIAIAGEVTPISLESALVQRVVQINLSPDTLTDNLSYARAFKELSSLELGGFALPYIRWCLGANSDELMSQAQTLLPATVREVPSRVRDNILIMTTGLVALKRFAAEYGLQISDQNFKTGVEKSIIALIAELFERGAYEIGLTVFLETLSTLAQTGRVVRGIHYTIDSLNTRLYINLPDCLAEFRKFVRETNARVEILEQRAYNRQAREVCQRKGYILDTNCTKWFEMDKTETKTKTKGKSRKCIEIDMERLPFDASGFEQPLEG